jgi:CBS-domain-containing membrane protein
MVHERAVRLGTRRRIVVGHTGHRVALSVFCPRELRSKNLDVCRRCPRRAGVEAESVTCVPDVEPAAAESLVGAVMGDASVTIEAGTPVGALTPLVESCGWMAVVVFDTDDRALGLIEREQLTSVEPGTVARVLARPFVPVLESSPVMSVVQRMVHERARAFPVESSAGSTVGIVTDLDALRWVAALSKKSAG